MCQPALPCKWLSRLSRWLHWNTMFSKHLIYAFRCRIKFFFSKVWSTLSVYSDPVNVPQGLSNILENATHISKTPDCIFTYLYLNETFTPTARRPRSRVTTPEEDERIRRAPTETRFTTATAIREALNLDVSATTVRRRLHEAGIHHRVPATKERLTAAHRAGRLAFANQYVGHDFNFWSRVVFSDEKTFSSFNHGRLHVWRENNTR